MKKRPVVLVIMDGYGLRKETVGNGVALARKPNIDFLWNHYPHTTIDGSGMAVGLPEGQMGNSEVGHMNIGAGRVVYQSLTLINKMIKDGEFYSHDTFLKAVDHVKKNKSNLHIFGLLSNGGVHSHIDHIIALFEMAKRQGLSKVYMHAFLDGRDVDPSTGPLFVKQLLDAFKRIGVGEIATISGRYYAMDRDKNFDRLDRAFQAIVEGKGNKFTDPVEYIKGQYEIQRQEGREPSDEFVEPGVNNQVRTHLWDNDAVIFANFRPDRAIQLGTVLTNPTFYANPPLKEDGTPQFKAYTPSTKIENLHFVCMMKYADSVKGPISYALKPLSNLFGEVLAERGLKQLRIAETEKYAHVTFFFDGTRNYDGKERPELPGCKRIVVNSPKVPTYDLKPEMSAPEVTRNILEELDKNTFDVMIINYANPDMVGHTAVVDAVIKAVETVDDAVGQIYRKVEAMGGTLIVTADHGNAEQLVDEKGRPHTAHTTNLVPFIVTDMNYTLKDYGKLGDIAPTMLYLLGEPIPAEMDGNVLVEEISK